MSLLGWGLGEVVVLSGLICLAGEVLIIAGAFVAALVAFKANQKSEREWR
jgi:hypothetical protein